MRMAPRQVENGFKILWKFRQTNRMSALLPAPGQRDVKREILKVLLVLVPDSTRQELMLQSEARKLWDVPAKLELDDEDLQREFCEDVRQFQKTVSTPHPRIKFGNLTALRLSLFSCPSLTAELAGVFVYLPIRDLGIENCVEIEDFMGTAIKVLAPSLQGLSVLRIHYDASAVLEDQDVSLHRTISLSLTALLPWQEGPNDYPWAWDSWSETLSLFPQLRTLWLRTPLALSEESGRALANNLDEDESLDALGPPAPFDLYKFLEELVGNEWTKESPSVRRVYIFFGYDDNLNIGDGLYVAGHRFRMAKLDSGDWKAVNIAYWGGRSNNLFPNLYFPFDSLPGILEDDLDPFDPDS